MCHRAGHGCRIRAEESNSRFYSNHRTAKRPCLVGNCLGEASSESYLVSIKTQNNSFSPPGKICPSTLPKLSADKAAWGNRKQGIRVDYVRLCGCILLKLFILLRLVTHLGLLEEELKSAVLVNMQRTRDCGVFSPKWDICITSPFLSKA